MAFRGVIKNTETQNSFLFTEKKGGERLIVFSLPTRRTPVTPITFHSHVVLTTLILQAILSTSPQLYYQIKLTELHLLAVFKTKVKNGENIRSTVYAGFSLLF